MNDKVIQGLFEDNLCTYFILPLLKLSKSRFQSESNFVDSYLSTDKKLIVVKVLKPFMAGHRYASHPFFKGVYHDNVFVYLAYKIPAEFEPDIAFFCEGAFSKISDNAKEKIKKYSGLVYQVINEEGQIVTDIRLLALVKSKAVQEMWESYFNLSPRNQVSLEGMELLSIPPQSSYVNLKELTPTKMEHIIYV